MKFYQDKASKSILYFFNPPEKVSDCLSEIIPGTVQAAAEQQYPAVTINAVVF